MKLLIIINTLIVLTNCDPTPEITTKSGKIVGEVAVLPGDKKVSKQSDL